MKRIYFFAICAILLTATCFADGFSFSMFNEKLSNDEKTKLLSGEMVIRNIDTKKHSCLKNIFPEIDKLNPNYTAEVIRIIPDSDDREVSIIDQLNEILLKLEDYAGIPYFSERTQSYWDLYTSVKLKSIIESGETKNIVASYEMEPFGTFDCEIKITKTDDNLYYMSKNLDKLRYYDRFTCVTPKNMVICISAEKAEGYTVLSAIGGVAAPSIWFLRERVETSFINRIKTFCQFMFKKLE